MLRQASHLPPPFGCWRERGGGGGFNRIGRSVTRVAGQVCGGGGMTRGAGGGASGEVFGLASSGMAGKCSRAGCTAFNATTSPRTRSFHGLARPAIWRVTLLEEPKHVL